MTSRPVCSETLLCTSYFQRVGSAVSHKTSNSDIIVEELASSDSEILKEKWQFAHPLHNTQKAIFLQFTIRYPRGKTLENMTIFYINISRKM